MHDLPSRSGSDQEFGSPESEDLEFNFEDGGELVDQHEGESPFSEADEMALAAELLSLSSEAELDQFLGGVFKKAWGGIKRFARSGVGRALGKALKGVAKIGLPIAGKAVGTFFGGPIGGMIGGKLASGATKLLGLELEGLSPEDAEFEVARRFVRLAGTAARNAAFASPAADPLTAAKAALTSAARTHVPGLVGLLSSGGAAPGALVASPSGIRSRSGRWIRRGSKIILLGV